MTCQWVNPDGSECNQDRNMSSTEMPIDDLKGLPQTFLFKAGNSVYITGDVTALRAQLGNPADLTQVVSTFSCTKREHNLTADT